MSGLEALKALRQTTIVKGPIVFYKDDGDKTELIQEATEVQFGSNQKRFKLDMQTNFSNEDQLQDLKSVVFCWLQERETNVDYKSKAAELGIASFKYLNRTELETWLSGSIETCQFIEGLGTEKTRKTENDLDVKLETRAEEKKRKLEDPQLDRINSFERESIDHNAALRGSKNIDFGYLISDAKTFMRELKRTDSKKSKSSQKSNMIKKQPIIIVSPATTALLSLSNVKEFLEEGRYTEPVPTNRPHSGVVIINHRSDRLVSAAQKIMVVDNTDLFTSPDYWNRVIAIFTTGQTWQFAKYKISQPESLFRKFPGFYLGYQGESTPPQIHDWNVREIKVDRGDKRFKDKVIVRDFWLEIEKILINKGYSKEQ
ncbi:CDC73 [Candida oxycetoniae]|uniref:CDC73 n=1 Tax=Candida oxycetoniae TaxID=497107 RepID=A0AAI9SVN9_9ASCO|nr:CDC73 [Candida oxycetoniae]KAI3403936.2 CDC73 [Candida oxycetoniae]